MQLIEDHTRQQDAPDAELIDSVQDLHWVLLPLAHPREFAAFVDRATNDDDLEAKPEPPGTP